MSVIMKWVNLSTNSIRKELNHYVGSYLKVKQDNKNRI